MALRDVDRLEEIVEKIKKIVEWYESQKFKNKKFKFYLTNEDSFMYSLPEDKIAHLLGVNINNIQTLGIYRNTSSYGLLKEFIENFYRISEGVKNDTIKLDYIFSKHVNKKINSFKRNINMNLNDISFVCKYDGKKAYSDGKSTIKCDYSIIKILEDGTILELDLVLSPDGKSVYPVSNKMYVDEFEAEEDLKNILEKQEIAIAHSMLLFVFDSSQKFYLKDYEKIEKINIIKKYIEKYDCYIDLIDECQRLYKNTNTNREKTYNNYDIYETIIDCITKGRIIETDKLYNLSTQQFDLIDAVNNHLIRRIDTSYSEENQESYSKLRKSVLALREAKQTLINENRTLKQKNEEQRKEIETLSKENELKNSFINNITNSFIEYDEKIKKISR